MTENMTPELARLNDLYALYLNARCRCVEQMPTQISALLATAMGAVDECERAPILSRADFKARIDHLLTREAYPRPSSEPVVVTHYNTFNIKDGDTNAIVAAFNKVTKPARPDYYGAPTDADDLRQVIDAYRKATGWSPPRLSDIVDSVTAGATALKQQDKLRPPAPHMVDGAKLARPDLYGPAHAAETAAAVEYFKGPKSTPDSAVDQRPTPMIDKQWHDFGHWLVTAFQPGKVDEAAVLHPGGKYESGPEFCRRALQLALDRGAFNHLPRSQTDEQVAKLQAMAFVARHANIPYEALVAMSDAKFASTLKLTEEMVASDIEAATKPV